MDRIKWLFMTKWQKFMYGFPIWHDNKQIVNLGNGYTLNFKKNDY